MSIKVAELDRDVGALPDGWNSIYVANALAKKRGATVRKLQTPDYLDQGELPIVDQGAKFICGYTDDLDAAYPYGLPVIVFGDHTRTLKYVDFPFAVGADGTQCLHPTVEFDDLFFFYSLQNIDLRSEGYARHFKHLKEQLIARPPLDEQRRIAEVLRSVDDAIAATRAVYEATISAQASAFETFLQSGNDVQKSAPVTGWITGKIDGVRRLPTGWRTAKLVEVARLESGHTPDRTKPEYWDAGDVEWISLHDTQNLERCDISQTDLRITQAGLANSSARLLPPGTVCFSRTATVGKCVIMVKSMATSQDFANFICSPELNNRYLLHLMRWMQPVWKALASGSTHKTIYMPTFKALQIILPPRAEQDSIAATMDSFVSVAEWHAASLISLRSMKAAIMSDLLSGRVRVPEQLSAPVRTVPAAFKRAVFAAEIVCQLQNDNRFGSVKHEKIVHLCELHLDLHNELDRHAYKKAAGPYDPVARRSVEQIFREQKWFDTAKPDGKRVVYSSLEKAGDHRSYFDRYFGEQKAAIQLIIDLLRPLDTERCEMIATAYAVWNDFIIDGRQPSNEEIVASILAWHPRKARISEDRWSAVLPWMRQQGLVPRGTGEKTRSVST